MQRVWPLDQPKLARDKEIAERVGLSRASLRNYLAAYDFVRELARDDAALARLLEGKSPNALNAIERAYRDVGSAALDMVRSNPGASTRELIASADALRTGRRTRIAQGRMIKELDRSFAMRQRWAQEHDIELKPAGEILSRHWHELRMQAPDLSRMERHPPDQPYFLAAGVKGIFTTPADRSAPLAERNPRFIAAISAENGMLMRHAAIMELPGYADETHYKWSARETLFKALGVAFYTPLVVVVLPTPALRDLVVEWLPAMVDIVTMDYEGAARNAPGHRAAAEAKGENSKNWVFPPGLDTAILFTSPASANLDLFGFEPPGSDEGEDHG